MCILRVPLAASFVRGLPRGVGLAHIARSFPSATHVELDNTWRGGEDIALEFETTSAAQAAVAEDVTFNGQVLSFDFVSEPSLAPPRNERGRRSRSLSASDGRQRSRSRDQLKRTKADVDVGFVVRP